MAQRFSAVVNRFGVAQRFTAAVNGLFIDAFSRWGSAFCAALLFSAACPAVRLAPGRRPALASKLKRAYETTSGFAIVLQSILS
jgi:hypothetical protein